MRATLAVLCLTFLLASCADERPQEEASERQPPVLTGQPDPDDVPADPPDPATGAPGSGYVSWINDLRAGLATVERQAPGDQEAALNTAQELYSSRHDPLVQYFGEGGSMFSGDALAQAVERSASAFRDMMRQLASADIDPALFRTTVQEARRRLDEVEGEARAAGLPPTAPRSQEP